MSSPIKLPPKGEVIRVKTLLGTIEEKFQIFQVVSSIRYNQPKLPVPYTRPPVSKVQNSKNLLTTILRFVIGALEKLTMRRLSETIFNRIL